MICLVRGESGFPAQLNDVKPVVDCIYAVGDLSLLATPMVSIVGTRDATAYGLRSARAIAGALSRSGLTIVSGMARGIDAAAHRAALEAGGKTIAVMGTGADVPYPTAHRQLHETICRDGLVISELGPGRAAHQGAFPKRNRIIAALGSCTIIVEAGHRSGAKITGEDATRLSRPLGAVPGPIDSAQSEGTNLLLRDSAAVMIASVEDALALAGVTTPLQKIPIGLESDDAKVWSAIGADTVDVDVLALRTGLPPRDCLAAVTALELNGMVECLVTGEVRRR